MTDVKFSDFGNASTASYPTPVGLQAGANVQLPANALARAIQDAIGTAVNFPFAGNVTALNLTGTNTGNETQATIGALINAATAKTLPADADLIGIGDSASSYILKKVTFSDLKTWTIQAVLPYVYARKRARAGGGGAGSVTSVALTMPASIWTVSGSPITTSGAFAITLANQNANLGFFGPTTGSPAAPTFRAMVPADMPPATSNAAGSLSAADYNAIQSTIHAACGGI